MDDASSVTRTDNMAQPPKLAATTIDGGGSANTNELSTHCAKNARNKDLLHQRLKFITSSQFTSDLT